MMKDIVTFSDEFFTRKDKPTIHRYGDLLYPFYICRFAYMVRPNEVCGFGDTACEAYLDWEKKNGNQNKTN